MAHLNAAGITRLVTKLKDRFAALAHTHAAATDITGQLPVANGGTGAATAASARATLDAAQDDSSGITLASAASNISTLLATTGIASTPSGKTLQGQISTLQDSVSAKVPRISIEVDNDIRTSTKSNCAAFLQRNNSNIPIGVSIVIGTRDNVPSYTYLIHKASNNYGRASRFDYYDPGWVFILSAGTWSAS